jgi:large conductance mechanosensitive channel
MSLAQEFKEFAVKGNVIDMAVGVIIGGAFGKIVSSFVADIVMPVLGTLIGGVNFSDLAVQLGANPAGEPVLLKYGVFLQNVLDFVIIAFAIFMAIKGINKLKRPAPAAAPAAVPEDIILLREIRDQLKTR